MKAYPYEKDHNFGPYGLSYADDRWELRDALHVRMMPKNADHPYHHKDIYIDKQTLEPLYSFAYDQKEELWKIIWHNKRWSEDKALTGEWYKGWPASRAARHARGQRHHRERADRHREPDRVLGRARHAAESKGKIRRYIDVGRLTKGR